MARLSEAQIWDKLAARGLAKGARPPEPRRQMRRMEESRMQRLLVRWFDLQARAKWGLSPLVLFSVPNGGLRGVVTASIMKAEGQRAGVPDLALCVARNGLHGLFLELKTPDGRVSAEQEAYHVILRTQGYRVEIIRSFDAGVEAVQRYLG